MVEIRGCGRANAWTYEKSNLFSEIVCALHRSVFFSCSTCNNNELDLKTLNSSGALFNRCKCAEYAAMYMWLYTVQPKRSIWTNEISESLDILSLIPLSLSRTIVFFVSRSATLQNWFKSRCFNWNSQCLSVYVYLCVVWNLFKFNPKIFCEETTFLFKKKKISSESHQNECEHWLQHVSISLRFDTISSQMCFFFG